MLNNRNKNQQLLDGPSGHKGAVANYTFQILYKIKKTVKSM